MKNVLFEIELLKSTNLFIHISPKTFSCKINRYYAQDKGTLKPLHIVMIPLKFFEGENKEKIILYFEYLFSEQKKWKIIAPLIRVLVKENYLILVYEKIEGVSLFHYVLREKGISLVQDFEQWVWKLTFLYDSYHDTGNLLLDQNLNSIFIDTNNSLILQEWGFWYVYTLSDNIKPVFKGILSDFWYWVPEQVSAEEEGDNWVILFILLFLFKGQHAATKLKKLYEFDDFDSLELFHDQEKKIEKFYCKYFSQISSITSGKKIRRFWKFINRKKLSGTQKMVIAVILLIGICIWGFIDYYKDFGKIVFQGLPVEAKVYLNNSHISIKNKQVLNLKKGIYAIYCTKDGYSAFSDTIQIKAGHIDTVQVFMKPGGYLSFEIMPENTVVKIDSLNEEKAQIANGKRYFLTEGKHQIMLYLKPYVFLKDTVKINKFENVVYQKDLSKLTGKLSVHIPSKEGKLYVEMDLKNLDIRKADAGYESQLVRIELPENKLRKKTLRIGHHRLIYKHPKYDDIIKEFDVIAFHETKLKIQLPQKKDSKKLKEMRSRFLGEAHQESKIPAGRLVINTGYKWHYLKGLGKQYENKRNYISVVNNIPPGNYDITLSNPHFTDFTISITIVDEQSDSLLVNLATKTLRRFIKSKSMKKYQEVSK